MQFFEPKMIEVALKLFESKPAFFVLPSPECVRETHTVAPLRKCTFRHPRPVTRRASSFRHAASTSRLPGSRNARVLSRKWVTEWKCELCILVMGSIQAAFSFGEPLFELLALTFRAESHQNSCFSLAGKLYYVTVLLFPPFTSPPPHPTSSELCRVALKWLAVSRVSSTC